VSVQFQCVNFLCYPCSLLLSSSSSCNSETIPLPSSDFTLCFLIPPQTAIEFCLNFSQFSTLIFCQWLKGNLEERLSDLTFAASPCKTLVSFPLTSACLLFLHLTGLFAEEIYLLSVGTEWIRGWVDCSTGCHMFACKAAHFQLSRNEIHGISTDLPCGFLSKLLIPPPLLLDTPSYPPRFVTLNIARWRLYFLSLYTNTISLFQCTLLSRHSDWRLVNKDPYLIFRWS
jgi:hypothetical protein